MTGSRAAFVSSLFIAIAVASSGCRSCASGTDSPECEGPSCDDIYESCQQLDKFCPDTRYPPSPECVRVMAQAVRAMHPEAGSDLIHSATETTRNCLREINEATADKCKRANECLGALQTCVATSAGSCGAGPMASVLPPSWVLQLGDRLECVQCAAERCRGESDDCFASVDACEGGDCCAALRTCMASCSDSATSVAARRVCISRRCAAHAGRGLTAFRAYSACLERNCPNCQ